MQWEGIGGFRGCPPGAFYAPVLFLSDHLKVKASLCLKSVPDYLLVLSGAIRASGSSTCLLDLKDNTRRYPDTTRSKQAESENDRAFFRKAGRLDKTYDLK